MGQKVHPLGFRLVTTQKHRSVWFSEFANYPNFLEEDSLIREYINTKAKQAGISRIEIKRNSSGSGTVTLQQMVFSSIREVFVKNPKN